MYDAQSVPVETEAAEMAGFDVQALMAVLAEAQEVTDDTAARALIGRYALTVPQDRMPEAVRIAMLESQLPAREWPDRTLRVTAVDAETGAFVVYDARAGAPLGHAIMASCSIPGVGPTMPIGDRLLMDGGIRSGTNADVADDCGRVIVIVCNPEPERSTTGPTLGEVVTARADGSTLIIEADEASRIAFGPNPLLMSSRAGSAAAGHAQGAAIPEEVAAFWR
jgi:NTE family protein